MVSKDGLREYPPSLVEKFRPKECLGVGGMSTVWLAKSSQHADLVAVKVATKELAQSAEFSTRFSFEADIAKCELHPALVKVHERGIVDGLPFIVMEALKGNSLQEVISEHKVTTELKARIGKEICSCLAALHSNGIVHRDIKPSNIFVEESGAIRLLDLGIARALAAEGPTKTGTILGSIWYLAPEYVCGAEVTPSIDIYSLGITLAETYANEPLFEQWETKQLEFLTERAKGKLCFDMSSPAFKGKRALIAGLTQSAEQRPRDGREALKALETNSVRPRPPCLSGGEKRGILRNASIFALFIVCLVIGLHHHYHYHSTSPKRVVKAGATMGEFASALQRFVNEPKRKKLLELMETQQHLDKRTCAKKILGALEPFGGREKIDNGKEDGLVKHKNRVIGLVELIAFLHMERQVADNDFLWVELMETFLHHIITLRDYESRLNCADTDLKARENASYIDLAKMTLREEMKPQTSDLAKRISEIYRRAGKVSIHPFISLLAIRVHTLAGNLAKANEFIDIAKVELAKPESATDDGTRYWKAAYLRELALYFGQVEGEKELADLSKESHMLKRTWSSKVNLKKHVWTCLLDVHLSRLRLALKKYRRLEINEAAFIEECRKLRSEFDSKDKKYVDNWLASQYDFENYPL